MTRPEQELQSLPGRFFGRGKLKRIILMTGIACLSVMVAFAQTAPATGAAAAAGSPAATAQTTAVDETTLTIRDNTPGANPAAATSAGFGFWDLLRMVVILALVVASIYGVFWIIRRGSGQKKTAETELIGLLGSQGLPGNRWLHLVSVQKQVFLVGSSDSSVSLIAEITDQESIDELKLQAQAEKAPARKNFADLLGGFFGGAADAPPAGGQPASGNSLDFIRRQRDRLKKM